MHYPIEEAIDLSNMRLVANDCDDYMMCGLPLFNHRWFKARKQGVWLPTKETAELPATPKLTLLTKTFVDSNNTARFEFELSGPPHMSIFLQPMEGVTVTNWSFLKKLIEEPREYEPPYHIYFAYGKVSTPLKFFLDLKVS